MIKVFALLFLWVLLPVNASASSAEAAVESNIEAVGKVEVYQSVEVTVNGRTEKKESRQPGKLELKMEQTGSASPSVTFIQESISSTSGGSVAGSGTSASSFPAKSESSSSPWFIAAITGFVRELFGNLSFFLKL